MSKTNNYEKEKKLLRPYLKLFLINLFMSCMIKIILASFKINLVNMFRVPNEKNAIWVVSMIGFFSMFNQIEKQLSKSLTSNIKDKLEDYKASSVYKTEQEYFELSKIIDSISKNVITIIGAFNTVMSISVYHATPIIYKLLISKDSSKVMESFFIRKVVKLVLLDVLKVILVKFVSFLAAYAAIRASIAQNSVDEVRKKKDLYNTKLVNFCQKLGLHHKITTHLNFLEDNAADLYTGTYMNPKIRKISLMLGSLAPSIASFSIAIESFIENNGSDITGNLAEQISEMLNIGSSSSDFENQNNLRKGIIKGFFASNTIDINIDKKQEALSIPAKKITFISGDSGSGKSSIAKQQTGSARRPIYFTNLAKIENSILIDTETLTSLQECLSLASLAIHKDTKDDIKQKYQESIITLNAIRKMSGQCTEKPLQDIVNSIIDNIKKDQGNDIMDRNIADFSQGMFARAIVALAMLQGNNLQLDEIISRVEAESRTFMIVQIYRYVNFLDKSCSIQDNCVDISSKEVIKAIKLENKNPQDALIQYHVQVQGNIRKIVQKDSAGNITNHNVVLSSKHLAK